MSQESYQFIIDDSLGGIWGRGWGGVGPRGGGVRLAQYKKFGMVLGMVFLPLEARRSLFPDWPWLCDESSPHISALHILAQILAGKFKMKFLPTNSLTKAFPVAQICPNFGGKIQNGVPANS